MTTSLAGAAERGQEHLCCLSRALHNDECVVWSLAEIVGNERMCGLLGLVAGWTMNGHAYNK